MIKAIILNAILLRAKYRLLFGFCPACNSDAPAKDSCKVCLGYGHPQPYPPPSKTKDAWYVSYKANVSQ